MRARTLVVVAVLGCQARPAGPSASTPVPAPSLGTMAEAADPGGRQIPADHFVYVRGGTPLFTRPAGSARSLPLGAAAEGWLRPIPARVLKSVGAYIEIETLGPDAERHCGLWGHWTSRFRLHGFVTRQTLVEVTTTPWEYAYGRNETVSIPAGFPVDRSDGRPVVEVGDERFPIVVDASVIGQSYAAAPTKPGGDCFSGRFEHIVLHNGWKGSDWRTFGEDGTIGLGNVGLIGKRATPSLSIREPTALFFEDGTAIGILVARISLAEPPSPSPSDPKRICFDLEAESNGEAKGTRLCIAASDAGRSAKNPKPMRVRQAKSTIQGSLGKDIVRRIVRSHINEIRSCYATGLAKNPNLKGRIEIVFDVGADGLVSKAVAGHNSVSDPDVGACIANAVKTWKFPKASDGAPSNISYPFILTPD